jgi:hypothetical protein
MKADVQIPVEVGHIADRVLRPEDIEIRCIVELNDEAEPLTDRR